MAEDTLPVPELEIPWIDSPFFERLLAESPYDEDTRRQIRAYAEDGFLVLDPEIPDFDAVAETVIEQCSGRSDYSTRIMDGWESIGEVRDLAAAPKILEWLEVLYGRPPIPMQTLNFGRGTQQRAHSDAVHFSSVPQGFMCGVWIALEDMDLDNGPLEYYPGSHRLPYFDLGWLGIEGSAQEGHERYADYEVFIQALIRERGLERRVLQIPKGRAILWAANLLHGGSPILDPSRTRHSQVTHYYFPDCLYYQPMRSDPFVGKVCWLDKRDVRTGEMIPQTYLGQPLTSSTFAAAKRVERWVRSSGAETLIRKLGLVGVLKRAREMVR